MEYNHPLPIAVAAQWYAKNGSCHAAWIKPDGDVVPVASHVSLECDGVKGYGAFGQGWMRIYSFSTEFGFETRTHPTPPQVDSAIQVMRALDVSSIFYDIEGQNGRLRGGADQMALELHEIFA